MADLFFEEDYGRLFEDTYKGKCEVFEFQHPLGTVKHLFIKREIPFHIDGAVYYDLITPFTYGGPLVSGYREEDKWDLMYDFREGFQKYCDDNNIVCEFVRFHPVLTNAMDFLDCYEMDYVSDTVGTNIAGYRDPAKEEFSTLSLERTKEALDAGVEYEISRGSEKIEAFKNFYFEVKRENPKEAIGESYFFNCGELFNEHLIIVEAKFKGEVIGMSLNFLAENVLNTHLIVTLSEYDNLQSAYLMQYGLTLWGKENGVQLIHHVGDWVDQEDSGVELFNKQFGKNTSFKYCIGRKVWNEEIYERLCAAAGVGAYADYFPAYRIGERGVFEGI